MDDDANRGRWGRRPRLARAIRVLVFLAPVAASVGAASLVRPLLPPAVGVWGHLGYLLALVAVSTVALVVVDRLARRALPLATLLDLSMLFPDGAPSRLRVARAAIKRAPIEEQLARVAQAGADPGVVAREILTLVAALSAHDRPTRGHAERVRMFTDLLAEELKIPERDRDLLRWAAILHDVGKLRVPTTLLNKPGKPTPGEWDVLRAHPAHGAEIAGALLPWLGEWGSVIVEHHERYDGTGYPDRRAGEDIIVEARVLAVCDSWAAMRSDRCYQSALPLETARRELVEGRGGQFDPEVVDAFLELERVGAIGELYRRGEDADDLPATPAPAHAATSLQQVTGSPTP
jgi:putative nucleotidyltransferase with HDIG domain